jgi:hypothetical protein
VLAIMPPEAGAKRAAKPLHHTLVPSDASHNQCSRTQHYTRHCMAHHAMPCHTPPPHTHLPLPVLPYLSLSLFHTSRLRLSSRRSCLRCASAARKSMAAATSPAQKRSALRAAFTL